VSSPAALPVATAPSARRWDPWLWVLLALAFLNLGNAVWMLLSPEHWYHELPARVPATGPFNEHFVRDIGIAFATVGVAYGMAALRPAHRLPLAALAACFLVGHALLHAFDSWRGYLPADHWPHDVPGVYAPAVLALALTGLLARRRAPGADGEPTRSPLQTPRRRP
jgi:hypothetical protein